MVKSPTQGAGVLVTESHQHTPFMKTLIPLAAGWLITSVVALAASFVSPVFQIRLVLDAPSNDSEPMMIVSKERQEVVNVQKKVLLDQTALKSVGVQTDSSGHPRIGITFSDEGRKRFAEVTRERIGQRLAIIIDGQLYNAPMIRTEIPGGKAEISGNFSEEEANVLAAKIIQAIRVQANPRVLSVDQAAQLAAKLANDECERRFHSRPFRADQHIPIVQEGKYCWGGLDVGASKGLSASVTFGFDGSHPSVEVYFSTDTLLR